MNQETEPRSFSCFDDSPLNNGWGYNNQYLDEEEIEIRQRRRKYRYPDEDEIDLDTSDSSLI